MSILNVNTIQPVGSGQTITVTAANITASSATITASSFVGSVSNTSGTTVVAAGSASAPSISPTGDSNTGIFFPAADTIAFAEGGVEAARFDSSGRFGLGTASPSYVLDVSSSVTGGIRYKSSGSYGYIVADNTSSTGGGIFNAQQNGVQKAVFGVTGGLLGDTSADAAVFADNGQAIRFYTNGTNERARIDSSGRLLIGTTSSYANYGTPLLQLDNSSGAELSLRRSVTTDGTNLGYITGYSTHGICASIQPRTDGTQTASSTPGAITFLTQASGSTGSPTERMRISSTGNVSIGTQNDVGYKLGIIATTTATPSLYLRSNAAGDVGTAQLRLIKTDATNTTSQIFIQFVIDGNNTNSGQINANGASQAAFGSFSDVRLKENIEDLPSQINNIKALRPVEFDYKDKSGHQIGFVAQEMEQIYPDAIGVGENEMLTITGWSKTEARLVKALQEAIAKIESLEARLAAAGI